MRTTLKRGIGRGASVNGNGSGNGRAILPPVVRTPMRRYSVPPPPRRTTLGTVGWFFRWLALAVVIVAVGIAGGAYLWSQQTLSDLSGHTQNVKKARKLLTQKVPDASQPAIALLVGYDARKGADASFAGSRSDTIMLVRADPQLKAVSMLSFPRDLLVPIYCAKGPIGVVDRINSAWARCGASGTVATVTALTHVRPDYLITVDFHGFKLLVNKLHGVYMDVDHRYLNTQGGPGGYAKIDLEPGYQKLDGEQALDFVRFRHTDSDITRTARQQLFLTALRERLAGGSIFDALKIVGALKGNLEIETGSGNPLSTDTALSYLQFAHGLPNGHFFRDAIDNLTGYNTLQAPQSSIDAAVQQFLHPDVSAPQQANAAALGIKPKPPKPHLKPAQVSVLVLNGTTTIQGGAADTSYSLAQQGFRTLALPSGQLPNAPNQGFWSQTQVYYDRRQPKAQAAAELLRKTLPGAVVSPLPANIRPFARAAGSPETVVVIGSNFGGVQAPAPPPTAQIPKHEPPQVYTSPGLTLDQIRAVRHRLPFVPMVPHVIESHSQLAMLEPVRVYKPAPYHKGLRLTFVLTTSGNEYWGIEETDWNDAPVLRHPTVSHVFHGRHFDFYYSGSHLHMVVLRTPKASYWVVNTLLDRLSNETMIAIARGLEPLGK